MAGVPRISANGFPRMDFRGWIQEKWGPSERYSDNQGLRNLKLSTYPIVLITIMNLAIALHTAGRVSSTPDEFHTIAKGGIHCSRRQIVGQRGCLPATVIGQSHVFVRCNCNYCKLLLSP